MRKINFCDIATINIKEKKKKILSRGSTILDCHIGKTFYIHKGNGFKPIIINSRMKGFRFGDFCLTRKQFSHKKKNK